MTRRELMAQRTAAIARKDWAEMNRLTALLADMPMMGVSTLTQKERERYASQKASAK